MVKKRKTNKSFSFDKDKKVIQVHNVHQVHSLNVLAENTKKFSEENEKVSSVEVRQLGAWFFGETEQSFDPHSDQAVYQTRSRQSAERMLNLVRDLTWPDFKAFVVDSSITLKESKKNIIKEELQSTGKISFHGGRSVEIIHKLHPCLNPIPKKLHKRSSSSGMTLNKELKAGFRRISVSIG